MVHGSLSRSPAGERMLVGMTPTKPPQDGDFQSGAVERLTQAFGSPRVIPAEPGMAFYRWILGRPGGMSLYLTLSCPERTDFVHLLLSDPREAAEPVISIPVRDMTGLAHAIERVTAQWRRP